MTTWFSGRKAHAPKLISIDSPSGGKSEGHCASYIRLVCLMPGLGQVQPELHKSNVTPGLLKSSISVMALSNNTLSNDCFHGSPMAMYSS